MSLGQFSSSSSSSFQSSLCWGHEWAFVFIGALFADDFIDAVLSVLLKKNLCASKWRLILETPLRGERLLDKERALQCRFCPRQNVVILPDLDMAKSAAFHSDNAAPCESLASWFKGLVIVSEK